MKRTVKILFLIDSSGMYGAEIVVFTLLKTLKNTDYQFILGCIRENDHQTVELGVNAEKVGIPVRYFTMNRGFSLRGILNIRRFITAQNILIVHSHGYKPNIYLGLMGLRRRVVITTVHGWAKQYADFKLSLYERLNCFFIRRFDKCIAVSDGVANDLISRRIKLNKIVVIRNGIVLSHGQRVYDTDRIKKGFNVHNSAMIVGLAGRLVKEKGIDVFIDAAHLAMNSDNCNRELHFLIAGTGPLHQQLEDQIKSLGISKHVGLIGFVPDIYEFLSILDIFVLSSNTEGLPMVLLEAMNAQVPVICTRVGGIPEVVNRENGVLIQPKDSTELARQIVFLADNEDSSVRLSQNGKRTIEERYSEERMANGYMRLYKKLLK